jgi:hypothetical protein
MSDYLPRRRLFLFDDVFLLVVAVHSVVVFILGSIS